MKFIPYDKLSKKKRREADRARRGSWGGINPVTRRPDNPKAYKRKKIRLSDENGEAFVIGKTRQHDGARGLPSHRGAYLDGLSEHERLSPVVMCSRFIPTNKPWGRNPSPQ